MLLISLNQSKPSNTRFASLGEISDGIKYKICFSEKKSVGEENLMNFEELSYLSSLMCGYRN